MDWSEKKRRGLGVDVACGLLSAVVGVAVFSKLTDPVLHSRNSWLEWAAMLVETGCVVLLLSTSSVCRLFASYALIVFSIASIAYHLVLRGGCRCLGLLGRLGGDVEVVYAAIMGLLACGITMLMPVRTTGSGRDA